MTDVETLLPCNKGLPPECGAQRAAAGRYAGSMDEEDKLARRDALQALLDNHYRGNRKKLYIAAGLTHGRISEMLTHGFDENLARDLEGQLGLPYRFFEMPPTVHAIGLTPRGDV